MSGAGCCGVCKLVGILAAIGAINWGLVAVADLDLVARMLGVMTTPTRVVYGIIGLAGLMKLVSCFAKICPCQKTGACAK